MVPTIASLKFSEVQNVEVVERLFVVSATVTSYPWLPPQLLSAVFLVIVPTTVSPAFTFIVAP